MPMPRRWRMRPTSMSIMRRNRRRILRRQRGPSAAWNFRLSRMLFNSWVFILGFLPVALLVFFLIPPGRS